MKDFVFLFPGQGSQVVGMGKDLYEQTEIGRKTFAMADDILGYSLSQICFAGPEEELKLTHNTQPALLTVSYILYQLLGKNPTLAAGHSLGEYSALVAAGALRYEDAVLLVHKRGKYMQEAVPVGQGAMVALIGADINIVRQVCAEVTSSIGVVDLANWNSANQIVISGEKNAVEAAVVRINAGKSVFLPVSAPFHSSLMRPAEERLAVDLEKIPFAELAFPVINNVDVQEVRSGDVARSGVRRQVSRPVLWHGIMEYLLKDRQAIHFAEIGTGKVLAGLLKRTAKDLSLSVDVSNIETLADIEKIKNFF